MEFEREKARLLAENLHGFVEFVNTHYQKNKTYLSDSDKLFRMKNLVDEYKFTILADEMLRVNQFIWDKKVTEMLVGRVKKGINNINEYVQNNFDGLFIFAPRIHTLKSICDSFTDKNDTQS